MALEIENKYHDRWNSRPERKTIKRKQRKKNEDPKNVSM